MLAGNSGRRHMTGTRWTACAFASVLTMLLAAPIPVSAQDGLAVNKIVIPFRLTDEWDVAHTIAPLIYQVDVTPRVGDVSLLGAAATGRTAPSASAPTTALRPLGEGERIQLD